MSTPSPDPQNASAPRRRLGLSRRGWLLVALAFFTGLVLFALVVASQGEEEFWHATTPDAGPSGQVFEPLPSPDSSLPASSGGTAPAPVADSDGVPASTQPIGAPVQGEPDDGSMPPNLTSPGMSEAPMGGTTGVPSQDSSARPIRSPAPDYPRSAMRRGEAGKVLVQVSVNAQGRPERVDVVQSSRSRALDRAAVDAVERWEFAPATRSGQPVASKVLIPIDFNP